MNIFNVQPRPRVLFETPPQEVLTKELLELVPTFKVITTTEKVDEDEYDILVTFASSARRRAEHLHVLSFGAVVAGGFVEDSKDYSFSRDVSTLANELAIPKDVPPTLATLLKTTVIPNVPEGKKEAWRLVEMMPSYRATIAEGGNLASRCVPLVHVGAKQSVYALLTHRGGKLNLVLPAETQQHIAWLRLFLDLVGDVDSDSVPPDLEWKTSDRWSPPEVSKHVGDLQAVRQAHDEALREFERREQEIQARLEESTRLADEGTRRILTSDGDELVKAVTTVLEDLGFKVRDMDDHHDERTGAKLEDLRVEDPSEADWLTLVEVKGYAKGAKVNDVPQITGRPAVAYTKETGQEPPAVWHIVNAWRGTNPSTRVQAIPNDDDLRPLTEAGGALIDTRDLYEAWRDVSAGKADAETVRTSLRDARNRWRWAPES
ncbi:hypothetical protein OVA06_19455 [Pseudarthrobacter sp. SL88]|uniref:hypothetical protein n=1 Tax=Pseudarthrobacter sp. SL88 TaxID=2994666 RepID=UPI002272D013|nr:hypothetical protein [Pseudarthrobacter sp. SL88]MCY1676850.1 hypothetical protein [Pseudarthrobacter sp. SL88]